MSKRTCSRNRVSITQSYPVVASLTTGANGARKLRTTLGNVRTSSIVVDTITPDGSETSDSVVLASRRELLTLLIPDRRGSIRHCAPFLAACDAKPLWKRNGQRAYSTIAIPKGLIVPDCCQAIMAIVAAEGTGTDQHIKDTRNGFALRRDYSAKKGPKRTYRIDGAPNTEEVGRPIQGEAEPTPLNNREAAREYWH